MNPLVQELMSSVVYPAVAALAAAAVKFVLDWSKIKAREGLNAAVERAAGVIAVRLGPQGVAEQPSLDFAKELADNAEAVLEKNFAATLKKLGPIEPGTLSDMVLGELGKLYSKQGKV